MRSVSVTCRTCNILRLSAPQCWVVNRGFVHAARRMSALSVSECITVIVFECMPSVQSQRSIILDIIGLVCCANGTMWCEVALVEDKALPLSVS